MPANQYLHLFLQELEHMQCKFCKLVHFNQEVLLKHCQIGGANCPRLYSDCVCTFQTSHLSRSHTRSVKRAREFNIFVCELCDFQDVCKESKFTHFGNHLRNQETVQCPFLACEMKTNKRSSFNCHRSRNHNTQDA